MSQLSVEQKRKIILGKVYLNQDKLLLIRSIAKTTRFLSTERYNTVTIAPNEMLSVKLTPKILQLIEANLLDVACDEELQRLVYSSSSVAEQQIIDENLANVEIVSPTAIYDTEESEEVRRGRPKKSN